VADTTKRHLSWGTAILVAFLVTWAIVILFGIAPSQFITRVNRTYAKVPDSRNTLFIRDMVSANYYGLVGTWLAIGAYQIQKLARRNWKIIAFTVLFVMPIVAFTILPEVVHTGINHYVSSKPAELRGHALYTADEWVYTMYWVGAMGFFGLLLPGWIFGLKKLEERFLGEEAERTSSFGRPVVSHA